MNDALDVRPLGDRAVRFARPAGPSAVTLVEAVRAWPGVVDVVVTAQHVAAYFAGEPALDRASVAALATLADRPARRVRDVTLRVRYDGADLADVARATGLTTAEVCAQHASARYAVEAMGFAPGFAYLTGLPGALHLPRRSSPRARVPAGSVAIAGARTAVYPFDSPGGWHLLGHVVDGAMFDARGARLQLGDRVRFVPA